jgi:16S rRNA (uracil1498-N3)-methyltransferase
MSDRFFLEGPLNAQTTFLRGEQAHHLIQVMRYKLGDCLLLFDGKGGQHVAEITGITKKQVVLRVLKSDFQTPATGPLVTVATAIPKGERQRFLVEKLVELGVDRLIPLRTRRSVAVTTENAAERFQKWVIEACKQCRRDYLMEIAAEQNLAGLIEMAGQPRESQRLLALPGATTSLADWQPDDPHFSQVTIVIGPEGGLEESELAELLEAGWQPVHLGKLILRMETAAMVAATLLKIGQHSSDN